MAARKKAAKKKPVKRKAPKTRAAKKPARKKTVRKPLLKKTAAAKKKRAASVKPVENVIGVITHYFPHVNAAVIKLKAPLSVGDTIKIKGHTTDFTQLINSMQIDHVSVNSAKKGDEIGLLVDSRARQHDVVIKP